jgi:mRNA interferase RelE/StbE
MSKQYSVEIEVRAAREIRALPRREQEHVIARTEALARNPRPPGCVKLSGHSELWRVRSGNYRIVYQIEDERLLVIVVKVGHRRDVYRGT